MFHWVILSACLEESITFPLDLPERLFPFRSCILGMDAVGFAASVAVGPARCCVLVLCILSLMRHLCRVPRCPSSPSSALLSSGALILLDLGLLEQTSHPCCLWQLLCSAVQPPFPACPLQALGCGFGAGSSLFGALRPRCSSASPDPSQLRVPKCHGRGRRRLRGAVGRRAQRRPRVASGITREKPPGIMKGIVCAWARER